MQISDIKLIVGLGNFGDKYKFTRHNIGFLLIDKLTDKWTKKGQGETSEIKVDGNKIILLKPQTYMNLSGRAVIEVMNFYKIKIEEVLVVHDDIDLKFAEIKIKQGGGNAGHNGLKSISEMCGNDYWRMRIGVGRPQNPMQDVSDFVLEKFTPQEFEEIMKIDII